MQGIWVTKWLVGLPKLLALMCVLVSSTARAQELVDAVDFAEQAVRDIYDKDKAGSFFPLTIEAQKTVRWGDDKRRIEYALRNGPVQRIERSTCTGKPNQSTERCTGNLYICNVRGSLAKQPLDADIAVCHGSSGRWELDALGIADPLANEGGATSPQQ